MSKFGIRRSSFFSAQSDEEMDNVQRDSVKQLRIDATQACSSLAEGVEQLRNETSQACSEIVSGVSQSFVSKEDLQSYHQEVLKQFNAYDQVNKEILSSLESLKKATLYFKHELTNRQQNNHSNSDASTSTSGPAMPEASNFVPQVDDNASTSTRYDNDHDVIMRSAFPYTVAQVPEPGLFYGDISETELFCQLCGDTFKTYPCKLWATESKINFVQSRLRGAARSWFQTKYPNGTSPSSLEVLLDEIKKAFPDVVSKKLKKINLVNLKHSYGKINDYIAAFRKLTADLAWPEEPLVLFFYNGLHPKFKEEINKMEKFPEKIEEITTKCILFESSQESKAKIGQISGNKSVKKKSSYAYSHDNNKKNKSFNNNNSFNKFKNSSNQKSNINGNNSNNHVTDVQKINTKN